MEHDDALSHFVIGFNEGIKEAQKRAADRAAVLGADTRARTVESPPPPVHIVEKIYGAGGPPDSSSSPNWMYVAIGGAAVAGITALFVALAIALRHK